MHDPDPVDGWRERIDNARELVEELGTVAAAAQHLRTITPEPRVLDPLIPILHERGYTGREIADRLEVSQARVSRRLKTLVHLGLSEPVDKARGGGGNRAAASAQVKAARAYRNAVLALLSSGLDQTSAEDQATVRALIGDTRERIDRIVDSWAGSPEG